MRELVLRAYNSQKRRDQLGVLDTVGGNKHLKPIEVCCDSFTIRVELLHLTNGPVSSHGSGIFNGDPTLIDRCGVIPHRLLSA